MHDKGGKCMHGKKEGHPWQEMQPLQRAVHILLECILVSYMLLSGADPGFRLARASNLKGAPTYNFTA